MANSYGQTWWGEQWLAAFNGIDDTNRLPRGRRYAGNGSVTAIEIKGRTTRADVQGRQRRPYRVTVSLPGFTTKEKNNILETVSSHPAVLARLLNRQLPEQTLELLTRKNISLFPSSWKDMSATCSCPDWAMPCKHIAAIIYLMANEIDKNPFLVFELHGMDLISAMEKQSGVSLTGLDAPPHYFDGWHPEPVIQNWQLPAVPAFENLDLTTIEPLSERIFRILGSKPLFYQKDFRDVMANLYKRTARCALQFDKDSSDSQTEMTRLNRLSLIINENGHFSGVESEGSAELPAIKNTKEWGLFLRSLDTSEQPETTRHYHHALMWQQIYRLAIRLTCQQAFIPAVYQQSEGKTMIHWQPALMSEQVKSLLEKLYSLCPPDLVLLAHKPKRRKTYLNHYADGKTQVDSALHSLISLFTTSALIQSPGQLQVQDVCQLFFGDTPCRFDSFETREYPKVIRNWLNRLTLGERKHRLHLIVEEFPDNTENNEELSINVQVEQNGSIHSLATLLTGSELSATQVSVLTDLALLADYLPDMEKLYSGTDQNHQPRLYYTLKAFTPLFLKTLPTLNMLGIQLVLPKSLRNLAYPQLSLTLSSSDSDNPVSYLNIDQLLRFNWQVAIGDKRVSADEFMSLVSGASGLVRMLDQYVMLDDARLQQLLKKLTDLPESLSRAQLLKAGLSGELEGARVDLSASAEELFNQLLRGEPAPRPKNLQAQLRPYQQRGFEWMAQNARIGFGSLLADDMGLGKTLQVITLLLHQKESGQLDKHKGLVVAPTSLLTNWRKELQRFAPDLSVQVYHGQQRCLETDKHDVVLTSYGLVRSDSTTLGKPRWRTLVIDEAQNIKNPGSLQTKTIKKLKADIRVGLSGTPVENRLREYWSLFDFTNKGYLGTQKRFHDEFASPIEKDRDQNSLQTFRKITAPFILRRLKTDKSIISDLPEKIESNRYCNLSTKQASLYQSTVDTIMEDIQSSEEGIERKGIIFKLLNALKQICNTPAQFLNHEQSEPSESGKLATFLEIIREATES
ncbi:SNF2-related protein, partial [Sansalvadorimonas sp. 2012CJ34-2]